MSGYGISQADMEASRLVFVSVKDARPRRKVAVPVPDGASWESFCRTVQQKLKLLGIDSIYLASSGEQVFRTNELQDIDELFVVESSPAAAPSAASATPDGNGTSPSQQFGRTVSGTTAAAASQPGMPPASPSHFRTPGGAHHLVGVADTEIRPAAAPHDDEGDEKYIKRNTAMKRSLQKFFPSMFQPGLPVTSRDAKDGVGSTSRKRRRRSRVLSLRNLLVAFALFSCFGTLLFLYTRLMPKLP